MIGRRGALGGILGAMSMPQRADQRYDPPAPGVQPGGRAGILRARKVIIVGTGGEVLVYSPAAAAGDLVASVAASQTTDPYGNTVLAGVTSYGAIAFTQMNGGNLAIGDQGLAGTPSNLTTNNTAHNGFLLIASGKNALTDHQATVTLNSNPVATGVQVGVSADNAGLVSPSSLLDVGGTMALGNASAPASVAGGAQPFASGGALLFVDGGDTNTYDTSRLTLVSNGATINSNVTRVNVFSHHLGIGTYEIDIWMVTTNTTAADAAAWSFAGSGGLVFTGLMDFTSMTAGTAVVGYGSATVITTSFNGQNSANPQLVHVRALVQVTTGGTITYGGLELVAGNTITVAANSRMRIARVVAT